jgi:CRISPR/Cas system CMR subunit Cmr4 (Cas7 group RAMP superfamily)
MRARLAEPIVIVTDDLFAWFARFALPVAPHVKLKENKTVDGRGFWYEETMAPDTLLIATLHANSSRAPKSRLGPGQIMSSALSLFTPGSVNPDGSNPGGWRYLQVGGSETTGAGWMRVRFVGPATPALRTGAAEDEPEGRA